MYSDKKERKYEGEGERALAWFGSTKQRRKVGHFVCDEGRSNGGRTGHSHVSDSNFKWGIMFFFGRMFLMQSPEETPESER